MQEQRSLNSCDLLSLDRSSESTTLEPTTRVHLVVPSGVFVVGQASPSESLSALTRLLGFDSRSLWPPVIDGLAGVACGRRIHSWQRREWPLSWARKQSSSIC